MRTISKVTKRVLFQHNKKNICIGEASIIAELEGRLTTTQGASKGTPTGLTRNMHSNSKAGRQ